MFATFYSSLPWFCSRDGGHGPVFEMQARRPREGQVTFLLLRIDVNNKIFIKITLVGIDDECGAGGAKDIL